MKFGISSFSNIQRMDVFSWNIKKFSTTLVLFPLRQVETFSNRNHQHFSRTPSCFLSLLFSGFNFYLFALYLLIYRRISVMLFVFFRDISNSKTSYNTLVLMGFSLTFTHSTLSVVPWKIESVEILSSYLISSFTTFRVIKWLSFTNGKNSLLFTLILIWFVFALCTSYYWWCDKE